MPHTSIETPRSEPNTFQRRGRLRAGFVALALLAGSLVVTTSSAGPAVAAANGLGNTPVMGFNDWNAFGCDVSAKLMEQTADYLVSSGLRDDGYRYVDIDDCWMTSNRNAAGQLVPDPKKFPDGIKAVAAYVHARGLKLGIYESAGATTCQGYPGSYGHEQTDADTFASWGVDLLKYDNCGTTAANSTTKAEYLARYTAMAKALKKSGRDILYSVCEWGNFVPWKWAPKISNQWRTTGDISDSYASMLSIVAQNAKLGKFAKPGAFNDPDMLEIGNGGMTLREYRSEFSLWSEMAAPLIAGTDLRKASRATMSIYGNTDVIAVDQDSLGKQGVLLSSANGKYIFAKPLANGDVSVALFNSTDSATRIATNTKAASVPSASVYQLQDLWSKQVTETAGSITADVPAHGTVMYRVHPVPTSDSNSVINHVPAHTALTVTTADTTLAGGASTPVSVRFENDGVSPVSVNTLSADVPKGWTLRQRSSADGAVLATDHSATARYVLTAPTAATTLATDELDAMASYHGVGGRTSTNASAEETVYSPVSKPYQTANTTGASAILAQHGDTLTVDAAGSGVNPAQSGFVTRAASDEYGAIYLPGTVSDGSTVTATVTAHADASGFQSNSSTGIMVRNDETAAGNSPEGVVLYVNGRGNVAMAWAANGGTTVDTTAGGGGPGATAPALPVQLKLVRSGDSYTGSYSTDGTTWTTVGTGTLPAAGAGTTQDAGVFHTSGSTSATRADFTGLSVS